MPPSQTTAGIDHTLRDRPDVTLFRFAPLPLKSPGALVTASFVVRPTGRSQKHQKIKNHHFGIIIVVVAVVVLTTATLPVDFVSHNNLSIDLTSGSTSVPQWINLQLALSGVGWVLQT